MRGKDRIEPFLDKFPTLWLKYPDLRFGQLVTILANIMDGDDDIFNPEEYQWSESINKYVEREVE